MSGGHTPGPWEWDAGIIPPDGPGRYAEIYIIGDDREPIILADFNDSIPEGRSNARLIAAAPDLLAALEEAKEELAYFVEFARQQAEFEGDLEAGYSAIRKSIAAIAKARGDA